MRFGPFFSGAKETILAHPLAFGALFVGTATTVYLLARTKPARELSYDEAMALVEEAASKGRVKIVGKAGRLLQIEPRIDGVTFDYLGTMRKTEVIDPRLLVLLLRFVERQDDLERVTHMGIFPGRSGAPFDNHNRGLGIDFRRFTHKDGSYVDVLDDWGKRSKKGQGFRLDRRTWAGHTFGEIVEDLARDATYLTENPVTDSSTVHIGYDRSYLIHPDHPNEALALMHQDHIHVQIGPTVAQPTY